MLLSGGIRQEKVDVIILQGENWEWQEKKTKNVLTPRWNKPTIFILLCLGF